MANNTNCNNNIEIKYNLTKEDDNIEKIKNIYILLKNVEADITYEDKIKTLIQEKNLSNYIEFISFENNILKFDIKFDALTSSDGKTYDGSIIELSKYTINNDDIFRLLYEVWKYDKTEGSNEDSTISGGKNKKKKYSKRNYKKNKTMSKKYIII